MPSLQTPQWHQARWGLAKPCNQCLQLNSDLVFSMDAI